jgi:H+/Cl- antiporter ClcA
VQWSSEGLLEIRYEIVVNLMKQGGMAWAQAFGICLGMSLAIVVIPAFLIMTLYPAASGPGIPELISFLNGSHMESFFSISTLLVKFIGLIAIVGSGLFSGIDGPSAHMGTIIALQAHRYLTPIWINFLHRHTRDFDMKIHANDGSENSFRATVDQGYLTRTSRARYSVDVASLGAAAGVAAAFRAPVGAVAFVLEEAITHFSPSIVVRTMFVTTVAYIFSIFISFIGKDVGLGYKSFSLFVSNAQTCNLQSSFWNIVVCFIMGILYGLFGYLYTKCVLWIKDSRDRLFASRPLKQRVFYQSLDLFTVIVITVVVVLFVPMSSLFKECTPRTDPMMPMFLTGQERCVLTCVAGDTLLDDTCPFQLKDFFKMKVPQQTDLCLPDETAEYVMVYVHVMIEEYSNNCTRNPNSTVPYRLFLEAPDDFTLLMFAYSAPYLRWDYLSVPEREMQKRASTEEGLPYCYYQMQSLLWNPPDHVLANLLLRGLYYLFDPPVLGVFFVTYLFLSMMIYGIALPTDLVIPNLIVGAASGRLLALAYNAILLQISANPLLVDPGAFAALGMAGLWAGVSRLPLTVCLVVIESTAEVNYLPMLLIVVVTSTITGSLFADSLYHEDIHRRNIMYLAPQPAHAWKMENIYAASIMSKELVVVPAVCSRRRLWRILSSNNHNGFPVMAKIVRDKESARGLGDSTEEQEAALEIPIITDEREWDVPEVITSANASEYQCVGLVTRSALETQVHLEAAASGNTIRRRRDVRKVTMSFESFDRNPTLESTDGAKPELVHSIQDPTLISILPLINTSPMCISTSTTVGKAYNLFRDLKLRHLLVTMGPAVNGSVVGIITRSDLIRASHHSSHKDHSEVSEHSEQRVSEQPEEIGKA